MGEIHGAAEVPILVDADPIEVYYRYVGIGCGAIMLVGGLIGTIIYISTECDETGKDGRTHC